MPTQDTTPIKDKIISFLEDNGPSLPVHIAKHINTNMLFASAFLSELLSNKKLKITNLRVGSSPIYYLPGQEPKLEKYSQYFKSKEREAYEILKENKFLKDEEQDLAIRVALRAIKDFAFSKEIEGKITWRYLTETFSGKKTEQPKEISKIKEDSKSEHIPESILQETKKELEKVEEPKPKEETKKDLPKEKPKPRKKSTPKKVSQKKNERFFNTIKEYLAKEGIEIEDIESFSRDHLILKVKEANQEKLLIAYNKKRITEEDIIKANKKAAEKELKFSILSLGEPTKKVTNLIEAIKNLSKMEKLE